MKAYEDAANFFKKISQKVALCHSFIVHIQTEMYCNDQEVMMSNPGWVELGVRSTSALSCTSTKSTFRSVSETTIAWLFLGTMSPYCKHKVLLICKLAPLLFYMWHLLFWKLNDILVPFINFHRDCSSSIIADGCWCDKSICWRLCVPGGPDVNDQMFTPLHLNKRFALFVYVFIYLLQLLLIISFDMNPNCQNGGPRLLNTVPAAPVRFFCWSDMTQLATCEPWITSEHPHRRAT